CRTCYSLCSIRASGSAEMEEDGPAITPRRRRGATETVGPWRLVWEKLRRQPLAMAAGGLILLLYLVAASVEFLAPPSPETSRPQYTYAPPQGLRFFMAKPDGGSEFLLHVTGYRTEVDKVALRRIFVPDETRIVPVGFFVRGAPYELWGLFPMDV